MKISHRIFLFSLLLILASCGGGKSLTQEKSSDKKGQLITNEKIRLQFDNAYLAAEKEKALGRNDKAIRLYQEAIEIFPGSAAAHYNLAELYMNEGRPDVALNEINLALMLDKSNVFYFELKSSICHALSKHMEAAKALEDAIHLIPGNPNPYFDAANEYIYAKDFKSALAVYDKMETRFGVGEDVARQKEQLYLRLGKPDKAVQEMKKLLSAAPGDARYEGMLAELYWNIGKKKEAVDLYKIILEKEPSNGYAHFGMAEYYRSENEKDAMLKELNEAFKDGRISSETKMNIVYTLLPLIDKDTSLKTPVFQLALTIVETHPEVAAPHALLGDLYMTDGKADKAITQYESAVDIDPASLEVWKQYCTLLLEADSMVRLNECADKALEYFPEQAILYYYKASAERQLKNPANVVSACNTGLGLFAPDEAINLQLYIMLADAQNELKHYEESDKAFDKALQIDHENVYVLNNYAYYLSLRKSRLEKAKTMSSKTLDLQPDDASFLDTYGWILFQMNRPEEAGKYIARALEQTPDSPDVLEHMGDVLHAQKRNEEALKYWKKALEKNPESTTLKQKIDGTYPF
ncbi:MAG: tetratricopeptide repeat protein [Bacteroidetes bacterium]|nr:tetratricopeptide repeat protein [Bacteroidota bacterium]